MIKITIGEAINTLLRDSESVISDELKKIMTGKSMKPNDQITFADLRYLKIKYYGFDEKDHIGELIVNKSVAKEVIDIFNELYNNKFPIEKMKLIDNYNANDEASMQDNNTSAFNYRTITGTNIISKHGQGLAIDINPFYNPYYNKETGIIEPKGSGKYLDRNLNHKGMIKENDIVVNTFKKHNWTWGGDWNNPKDYQHFEK